MLCWQRRTRLFGGPSARSTGFRLVECDRGWRIEISKQVDSVVHRLPLLGSEWGTKTLTTSSGTCSRGG
jgi:hypothetical protein